MTLRRRTIGLVTLESTHSYTTQLWLGANDCAAHLDLNLITFGVHKNTFDQADPGQIPAGVGSRPDSRGRWQVDRS